MKLLRNSLMIALGLMVMGTIQNKTYAQKKVQKKLENIAKDARVAGMQIVHFKDGKEAFYNIGEKEMGSGNAVDENSLFQACSMSKSVFAYIVMRLYDKGIIDLNKPLPEYWEYPRLSDEPRRDEMTAKIALEHRTGLPNWTKPRGAQLKAAFKPGTKFKYSGEGYYYLQQVIEHITGKTLEELAEEEVFKPLGMKSSHYIYTDDMKGNYVHGHDDTKPRSLRKYTKANAAYSLITNAHDYTVFVQKGLIEGEGLKPETLKMMLTPYSKRGNNTTYGLGVQMQNNEKGKGILHNGSNPGFRCFYFAYPETGESIVCFTNSTNGVKVKKQVIKLILGDQTFYGIK